MDLWCRKRPLYQLRPNHCPNIQDVFVSAVASAHEKKSSLNYKPYEKILRMAAFTWSTRSWTLLGTFLFQAGTPEIKKEEKGMDKNSFKMSNSYTLYCFYKEREYPAFPTACMTRQCWPIYFHSPAPF